MYPENKKPAATSLPADGRTSSVLYNLCFFSVVSVVILQLFATAKCPKMDILL